MHVIHGYMAELHAERLSDQRCQQWTREQRSLIKLGFLSSCFPFGLTCTHVLNVILIVLRPHGTNARIIRTRARAHTHTHTHAYA